jgi:channel protein (hemolysin III family)
MTVHPNPGFIEPVNAILHLGAAGAFAILGIRLIRRGSGDRMRVALMSVFVIASVLTLSVSGLYHMLAGSEGGSAVLLRLDMAAIFVPIAGTFTPVHGLLFRGAVRSVGLALMWAAAASGVTLGTIYFDRMPYGLATTLYLALGWSTGITVIAAGRRRGFRFIRPILAGGIAYSVGAILLELNWPTIIPRVFGPHELWHVAVIAGLGLHWRFIVRIAQEAQAT